MNEISFLTVPAKGAIDALMLAYARSVEILDREAVVSSQRVLAGLLAQVHGLLDSIAVLCDAGRAGQAYGLARSLLDISVWAIWIVDEDPESRAAIYISDSAHHVGRLLKRVKSQSVMDPDVKADTLAGEASPMHGEWLLGGKPGPSVTARIDQLKRETDRYALNTSHARIFPASADLHGGIGASSKLLVRDKEGGVRHRTSRSPQHVRGIAAGAYILGHWTLTRLAESVPAIASARSELPPLDENFLELSFGRPDEAL